MAFILARRLQPMRGLVDLVPAMTVVLLLLLFFLLGSSFVLQPGVRVNLPHSNFSAPTPSSRLIVAVTLPPAQLDANGLPMKREPTLYFDDKIVTLDELRIALDRLPAGPTSSALVIKADADVPLDEIMRVQDVAFAHHLQVVIGTQAPPGSL